MPYTGGVSTRNRHGGASLVYIPIRYRHIVASFLGDTIHVMKYSRKIIIVIELHSLKPNFTTEETPSGTVFCRNNIYSEMGRGSSIW